jgi:hypothetical protein
MNGGSGVLIEGQMSTFQILTKSLPELACESSGRNDHAI